MKRKIAMYKRNKILGLAAQVDTCVKGLSRLKAEIAREVDDKELRALHHLYSGLAGFVFAQLHGSEPTDTYVDRVEKAMNSHVFREWEREEN
jgi:hypothetical protein